MPHAARKVSESGYHHVVPKGESNRIIFEDDGDRLFYLQCLQKAKETTGIRVRAYVLMSNHVHLVVDDEHGRLGEAMKLPHERYAMYFKAKAGRTGRVFRKPLWSEPIESDEYLLCAVRYVHANPAAAGICPASAYEWSSAKDYLGRDGITDTDMVLGMVGGRKGFIEFSRQDAMPGRAFPGSLLSHHLSEDEATRIARRALGQERLNSLESLDRGARVEALRILAAEGLTQRQIARVTGLGAYFIEQAVR